MQRPIAIISTGHTFPEIQASCGDFHDWIHAAVVGTAPTVHINALEQAPMPQPSALSAVIVTGSHAMVTDHAPWSESLAAWLRQAVAAQLPTLGICYGHQLLAYALGGQVGYHPKGPEICTHTIHLSEAAHMDPLFSSMEPHFQAHLVHAQSVLQLPASAQLLAHSTHEPHQAFRVGTCAWGVQFHPEFPTEAMCAYIERLQAPMHGQTTNWQALSAKVAETATANNLLAKFAVLSQSMTRQKPIEMA